MDGEHFRAAPNNGVLFELFNTVPIGIALENLDGQVLFANPSLCSMLRISEENMRQKHCYEFSPPEDSEQDWRLFQQLRTGSIDYYEIEKRFHRPDGSLVWGRLHVTLLFGHPPSPVVFASVQDITDRKRVEQELTNVGRKLVETQEAERRRIAQELHDDISQQVALLAIEIDRLILSPSDAAVEVTRQLHELKQQIREISLGIHSLSHQLYSPELEHLGLSIAMRDFCERFAAKRGVQISFGGDDFPKSFVPNDVSLCLFRILQEGLQNAVKHSNGKQFEVNLQCSRNQIHLVISDDGIGFDPGVAVSKAGLGLISMYERARLVNGAITIESRGNSGTKIDVRVPLAS